MAVSIATTDLDAAVPGAKGGAVGAVEAVWPLWCALGSMFAPRVHFPCLFPKAGDYRLFVQIKEDGRIETAAYDVSVAPPAAVAGRI